MPSRVTTALRGIHFHRHHRDPLIHPVVAERISARADHAETGAGLLRSFGGGGGIRVTSPLRAGWSQIFAVRPPRFP